MTGFVWVFLLLPLAPLGCKSELPIGRICLALEAFAAAMWVVAAIGSSPFSVGRSAGLGFGVWVCCRGFGWGREMVQCPKDPCWCGWWDRSYMTQVQLFIQCKNDETSKH